MIPSAALRPPLGDKGLHELWQRRTDLVHRQGHTDHARGRDEHVLRRDLQQLARDAGHLARVPQPLLTGADVGTPAVGDDRLRHPAPHVIHGDEDGRALDLVRGEDGGCPRRGVVE
jgi:hypothetical protein